MSALRGERGGVWVVLCLMILAFWGVLVGVLASVAGQNRSATRLRLASTALHLAEGGLTKAVWEIGRGNAAYAGETETPLGAGTFTVEVRREDGRAVVVSTAYIPNKARPRETRTIRAVVGKTRAGVTRALSWRAL